jgi:hypothetical protein
MIVEDLLLEQSAPWETITQDNVDKVWKAAKKFISLTTSHITDAATCTALIKMVFEPALNQLMEALKGEANRAAKTSSGESLDNI